LNLANITYSFNGTSFNYGANYSLTSHVNLTKGLVLLMNFDNESAYGESYNNSNGTIIKDYSGYGNNGTLYVGAAGSGNYTTGRYGGAYNFDGRDDYVDAGNNLNFSNNQMTSLVWISANSITNNPAIFDKDWSNSIYIQLIASNGAIEGGVNGNYHQSNAGEITTGIWYQIGYSYNKAEGQFRLYKNGVMIKNFSESGNIGSNSNNLIFGSNYLKNNVRFNGSIDEVAIWNRSLSADEIRQLYLSQVKKYVSTNETYLYSDFNNSANPSSASNATMKLYSDDNLNWNFVVNQSEGMSVGQYYNYFVRAIDLAGNINTTEIRTVSGNSKPSFTTIIQTPVITALDELDPGIMINITANVSDVDANYNYTILQWKNASTGSSWNNITMIN